MLQGEAVLSSLSVEGVCELLPRLEELSAPTVAALQINLRASNVSGKVLALCDLADLKQVGAREKYFIYPLIFFFTSVVIRKILKILLGLISRIILSCSKTLMT